jgi:hypothetical protein
MSQQRAAVNILFLCASSRTVPMNPPKLVELVNYFFPSSPRNYYYIGDTIASNSNQCRTDITKDNWISKCEFASVLFDMIIVEFCPLRGAITVLGPPFYLLQGLLAPNGIFSIILVKQYGIYTKGNAYQKDAVYIEFEGLDIANYLPDLTFIESITVGRNNFLNFRKN